MSATARLSFPSAASWAPITLAISSLVPVLGLPIIVGALVDRWGYSAAAAGYVASSDLAGLCLGSMLTSAIAERVSWRYYVGGAIGVCICLNIACASMSSLAAILVLRLAAGMTSGMVYSAGLTLLSRSDDAARDFSLLIFLQVLANALVLAGFPGLARIWGPVGLFAAIAATLAATLAIVPRVPAYAAESAAIGRRRFPDDDRERRLPSEFRALPGLCLLAVALFYVTIGSYWAYAERMGIQFGLSVGVVHELLAFSVLLSAGGCVLAFWLSRRFGQSRPLLAALTLLSATLLLHAILRRPAMFVVTLAVQQLCWNFVDIFQLGTLAIIEPSGRAAALVPAAQGVALALGPAAAAALLANGKGYTGVLALGGTATVLAAIVYSIVHRRYQCAIELRGTPF